MNNSNRTFLPLALALFSPALTSTLHASTVISAPSGGVAYNSGLSLGGTDAGSVSGAVGQWSWQDPAVADANVPNGGWGHTSNWIAITLTEPAILQIPGPQCRRAPDSFRFLPGIELLPILHPLAELGHGSRSFGFL
jgi:hypothetical protein